MSEFVTARAGTTARIRALRRRRGLGGSLALVLALAVMAPQVATAGSHNIREPVQIRIPAQSLDSALLAFSRQTGLSVMVSGDLAKERLAPTIEGRLTPIEALQMLLSESDLDFRLVGKGTITIFPKRNERPRATRVSMLMEAPDRPDPAALQELKQSAQQPRSESANVIEQIVVTARRREESLIDVPIAVTAISGSELEDLGAVDITDINQMVPNVTIEVSRGTNTTLTPFIRGVGQQDPVAGFEQGVGVYIDDVYLNRPQGAVLDLYDVERVEVLRGPQGTLYGRNTIGGAIKYVTRKISDEPELRLKLSGGSYRQFDAIATFSLPLSDTFKMGGTVARFTRDGFGDNLNLEGLENYNKDILGGRLSFEWTPRDDLFIRVAGDWTDDNSDPRQGHRLIPGAFSGAPVLKNIFDTRAGLNNPKANTVNRGVSGLIEWDINSIFTLKNIVAYRDNLSALPEDFDSLPVADLDVPVIYKDHQFTEEAQLLFQSARWSGVAGFFYMNAKAFNAFDVILDELGGLISLPGLNAFTLGDVKTDTWSLFFDMTYALSDQFDLSVGGRYTSDKRTSRILRETFLGGFSEYFGGPARAPILVTTDFLGSKTFQDFTPRASLSWKPDDNQNVYFSFSQGFKGGSFDPRGSAQAAPDLDGDGVAGPSDPEDVFNFLLFKPETITTYEVGHKGAFLDGRFRHSLALFWSIYKDVQIPGSVGVDTDGDGLEDTFVGITSNAGRARIRGVEWEADAHLADDLFGAGSSLKAHWAIGYIDAQFKRFINAFGVDIAKQAKFQNTPKWTTSVSLTASAPLEILGTPGTIQFIPVVSYRSLTHQFEISSPLLDQPGYALFDVSLVWTSDDGRWQVGIHGRNLTDKRYIVSGFDFVNDETLAPELGLEGTLTAFYGNPRQVTGTVTINF